MNFKNVNWLAIIAAVVASMALGFLWYGNLFMEQWMAGNGFVLSESGETMIRNGEEISPSMKPMIVNAVAMLVYALFMRWLLEKSNALTLAGGFKMGFVLGLIMYIGVATNNMFAMTENSLTQIDGFYAVVLWTVIGIIIGAWQKKSVVE